MPLIYQKMIVRADLQRNPQVLYVFGDNLQRTGFGGQAKEMRGEPNAIGVATKRAPGRRDCDYFSDDDLAFNELSIYSDLKEVMDALARGRVVVWPADGLGTGLSQLPTRAPQTWDYLERCRKSFEI